MSQEFNPLERKFHIWGAVLFLAACLVLWILEVPLYLITISALPFGIGSIGFKLYTGRIWRFTGWFGRKKILVADKSHEPSEFWFHIVLRVVGLLFIAGMGYIFFIYEHM
jgi:hypothetical protein